LLALHLTSLSLDAAQGHTRAGTSCDKGLRLVHHIALYKPNDSATLDHLGDRVAPLAKNTWTFGGNWQVHRWVRVQGNLIRETLVDSLGVRDINTEPRWTAVMRFQFAM